MNGSSKWKLSAVSRSANFLSNILRLACPGWLLLCVFPRDAVRIPKDSVRIKPFPPWHVRTVPLVMIVPSGKRNLLTHRRHIFVLFNWITVSEYSGIPITVVKLSRIAVVSNKTYLYFLHMSQVSTVFILVCWALYNNFFLFSTCIFAVQRPSTASILRPAYIDLIIAVQSARVNYLVLLVYLNYSIITIAK